MFKCKACPEKDLRIGDLKEQVKDLRKLVFPEGLSENVPDVVLEAEAILAPQDASPGLTPQQSEAQNEISEEAERIFAGNY